MTCVALAGGITLFVVATNLFRELEKTRAKKSLTAFGIAPLDGGRGAAFVLGGRF